MQYQENSFRRSSYDRDGTMAKGKGGRLITSATSNIQRPQRCGAHFTLKKEKKDVFLIRRFSMLDFLPSWRAIFLDRGVGVIHEPVESRPFKNIYKKGNLEVIIFAFMAWVSQYSSKNYARKTRGCGIFLSICICIDW